MSANASSPTRRDFLSTSAAGAVAIAASQLAAISSADAQPGKAKRPALPKIRPGTNTSFSSLRQIEAGPASGPAVILLHGWPYDIYSFVDVAPLLASTGYRVIVPHLRGGAFVRCW